MDELTVGIAALERTPLFAGLDREDLQMVLGCNPPCGSGNDCRGAVRLPTAVINNYR
jgi:hypothetical protein